MSFAFSTANLHEIYTGAHDYPFVSVSSEWVPLTLASTRVLHGRFHADLTKAEQEALAFVYDLRNKFESGEIPLEEPEGNGIFGALKKAFQQ